MDYKKTLLIFALLLMFLVSGCSSTQARDPKMPNTAKPEAGKATVVGQVLDKESGEPIFDVEVWLAETVRQADQGAYVLDIAFSPGDMTDENGYFAVENVPAMEYVIVVGNPYEFYTVIPNEENKPKTWNVAADNILDVGILRVYLGP